MARTAQYLPDPQDAMHNPAYPEVVADGEETEEDRPTSFVSALLPGETTYPITPTEETSSVVPGIVSTDAGGTAITAEPETARVELPAGDNFIEQMTGLQRGYSSTIDENSRRFNDLVTRDRLQMQKQYERQQFAAGAMPAPWQADKERAERIRGPFENFGSLATIFGMFASAATRTPLTSALNAGAAAMTAIRDSDEKAYESAYKAWKDNTNLALKQFEMENKLFDDSLSLMNTDLATWRATSMANEASFNNKKALLFLENGMDKEYLQAKEAQAKSAAAIKEYAMKGEVFEIQRQFIKVSNEEFAKKHSNALPSDKTLFRLNTVARVQAGTGIYGIAQQQVARGIEQYMMEKGEYPPSSEINKMVSDALAGRYAGRQGAQVNQTIWNGFYQEAIDKGMPEHEAQAYATKKEAESHSRAAPRTPAPNRAGTEAEYIEQNLPQTMAPKEQGGMGLPKKEATEHLRREWRKAGTTFTANQAGQMQERVDVIDNSLKIFDKAEGLLDKHWGLPGSTGYVKRGAETVGNLFGVNRTEANMFKHHIDQLQLFAKQALQGREGRALSAEENRMADIIAGLSMTSTTYNTKEAFKDLRQLYRTIRQQTITRLNQEWTPDKGSQPAPAPTTGGNWWQNAPGYKP